MRRALLASLLIAFATPAVADLKIVAEVPHAIHSLAETADGSIAFLGTKLGIVDGNGGIEWVPANVESFHSLVIASDGAFWMRRHTWRVEETIRRVARDGTFADYPVRYGAMISDAAATAGGDVFFLEAAKDLLARITPAGEFLEIGLPASISSPSFLIADGDSMWLISSRRVASVTGEK